VKQVHALGVATWFCAFNIYDEDQKGSLEWGSNTEGTYEKYRTPREGIFLRYYEAGQRGDTFLINEIGENECPAHYDYLCSLPGVGDQLLKMKDAGISFPSSQIDHVAYFKYGYILFITFEPAHEAHDIFKRFAKVFEQTYTRFLDLQKAEAQAREAQIEAALERVRAKTMAMHNSQDVGNTVITLFDEVLKLGLDKSIRCGIGILDKATDHMETWSATSYSDGEVDLKMGLLDMKIHPMLIGLKKAWESGKSDYQYDYIGDDVLKYYKALNNEPEYPFQINLNSLPENEYHRSFFYTEGILFAFAPNPISEEAARVLNRFAGVFGQTYRRYLDLQKAEARELEAIKEASLDRVRAEIASMRTTQDLERITPLIWRELTTLNVPFFRCGVFIVNEEVEEVQVYLSNPTGDSLAAWHSDYKVLPLFRNTVKQWRLKKVYHTRWDRKEFIEFTQSLIDHGLLESPESYLDGEEAPASLDLQMVPFKQGMLYVGSAEALIGSQIEIVQSLADAFAVAYSRYDDFRQLENAKRRIETTLEELKDTQSQLVHAEKMASLGELTAGIAHEIQNPLNFVNNFSEVNSELLEELDKGDLEEARIILEDLAGNEEKIKHHGKRADGIVRGMLQHSRTSQGEKEQTNINALADEYIRLAYHGLRAKDKSFNADFKLNFDENLPGINVIPQDIGRVLLNLINNAFYAVDKKAKEGIDGYKPEVIVSTKKLDDKIEISVKDNGDGIPEQVRDKIFQPFFTTKPTGSGTGLGLSLSYDIVKAHGGEIQVESKDGFGSEFIIFLPLKLE
jgi:signal transduction histidine kinase